MSYAAFPVSFTIHSPSHSLCVHRPFTIYSQSLHTSLRLFGTFLAPLGLSWPLCGLSEPFLDFPSPFWTFPAPLRTFPAPFGLSRPLCGLFPRFLLSSMLLFESYIAPNPVNTLKSLYTAFSATFVFRRFFKKRLRRNCPRAALRLNRNYKGQSQRYM